MNKSIIICLLAIVPSICLAQYDGKGENEISRFKPGAMWFYTGLRPAKEGKARKYDRLVFDVTYNDWIGDRDLFKNHWASIGLNTNWMFDIPITRGNTVSLGLGVSHQWVNIRHDNHLVRVQTSQSTLFQDKSTLDSFKKSKYGSHSFSVPVELRFRKEGWKHFKVHLGGKIGYTVKTYSKYKGNLLSEDFTYENKTTGFYDVADLIYSAHVRIGLRNWALFGSYNLNKLFTNSVSTDLKLVQLGVSISIF